MVDPKGAGTAGTTGRAGGAEAGPAAGEGCGGPPYPRLDELADGVGTRAGAAEQERANRPPGSDAVIHAMSRVCAAIAAGDRANLDQLFALTGEAGAHGDATGARLADLAEAFGMMIVQLEVREFELKQTVDALRESTRQLERAKAQLDAENRSLRQTVRKLNIEIDHSRKESEVSEIVDSDYFRQLQEKAHRMRGRTGGRTP